MVRRVKSPSQHTELTLENKILPPLLPGFELATFRSRTQRSYQEAIPALIRCPSHPVTPQWHVKDPSHSAENAGGRLQLNTQTPLTQRSRSGLTMPLSTYSVGTYPKTSSHATCQETFGHSRLSSLSHCGLILA